MAMRNPTSTGRSRIALTAVATQLGIMFIGAILPTPLYPLYREAFGFSGVTLTLISAISPLSCSSAASPIRSDGARRACRPSRSAWPAPLFLRRRKAQHGCSWRAG
jgi:hypothetical protein